MTALYLSGAGWLLLHWLTTRADAEAPPHPAQPWLMKVHGAAAMLALVVLGTLIPLHIRRGWRAHRNRTTGAIMVGVTALLILTGSGLYYAGSEALRDATANIHDAVGLALPLIIVWHVVRGRRSAENAR